MFFLSEFPVDIPDPLRPDAQGSHSFSLSLGQKSGRTKVPRIFRILVPNFLLEFCSENSPKFKGIFMLRFPGNGDQKKITKNPRLFQCKIPRQMRKNIHKMLLESRQSNLSPGRQGKRSLWCGRPWPEGFSKIYVQKKICVFSGPWELGNQGYVNRGFQNRGSRLPAEQRWNWGKVEFKNRLKWAKIEVKRGLNWGERGVAEFHSPTELEPPFRNHRLHTLGERKGSKAQSSPKFLESGPKLIYQNQPPSEAWPIHGLMTRDSSTRSQNLFRFPIVLCRGDPGQGPSYRRRTQSIF